MIHLYHIAIGALTAYLNSAIGQTRENRDLIKATIRVLQGEIASLEQIERSEEAEALRLEHQNL